MFYARVLINDIPHRFFFTSAEELERFEGKFVDGNKYPNRDAYLLETGSRQSGIEYALDCIEHYANHD